MMDIKNQEAKLDSNPLPEDILTNPLTRYNVEASTLRGMRAKHALCAGVFRTPLQTYDLRRSRMSTFIRHSSSLLRKPGLLLAFATVIFYCISRTVLAFIYAGIETSFSARIRSAKQIQKRYE